MIDTRVIKGANSAHPLPVNLEGLKWTRFKSVKIFRAHQVKERLAVRYPLRGLTVYFNPGDWLILDERGGLSKAATEELSSMGEPLCGAFCESCGRLIDTEKEEHRDYVTYVLCNECAEALESEPTTAP